jgi:hypothetical protein
MVDDAQYQAMEWRVHPARERVGAAVLSLLVLMGFAWLAADLMQNRWWGAFSGAFLFLMLSRFYLPSEFSIDETGITAKYPWKSTRFKWSDVRSFQHDERGGYLSTRRPSLLDTFRGIHLLFHDNREAVVSRIRASLPNLKQEGQQS